MTVYLAMVLNQNPKITTPIGETFPITLPEGALGIVVAYSTHAAAVAAEPDALVIPFEAGEVYKEERKS